MTAAKLSCMIDDMIHMRIWRPVGSAGVEYLTADNSGELLRARSTVIGLERGSPFRLTYEITHEVAVGMQEATIEFADGNEKSVQSLHLDRSKLADSNAIDIPVTPFTKSPAIRTLDLSVGESREISVARVRLPRLRVETVEERYTRLDDRDGEQIYRYEPDSGDTAVELAVDSDGFVGDYPGRFKRILL